MQPADVLAALRSRWPVVLLIALLGAAAAWVFTPTAEQRAQAPRSYEARHVLLYQPAPSAARDAGAQVNVLAFLATVGEIPARVAAELGYEGGGPALSRSVEVTANQDLGVIEVFGRDEDPEQAVRLADTMAARLIRHLDEQSAAERQAQQAEDLARAEALRNEIAALDARIIGEAQNRGALTTQRDALAGEYGSLVASLAAPTESPTLRSIEPATALPLDDDAAFEPPSSRIARVLIGLVVSTILALGLVVVLDRADDRIRSKSEAERTFRLPVIAGLHPLSRQQRRTGSLVAASDSDVSEVETYRALRAAILLFQVDHHEETLRDLLGESTGSVAQVPSERRVILVTSAEPSEGKSTTAANLAASFVNLGRSVLLINGDAASSTVDEIVGASPDAGTLDFLRDPEAFPLEAIAQESSVPGLLVVPRGRLATPDSRAPDSERRLVSSARRLADIVIIDSGPLLVSSFSGELATLVDAVIVMCWSGKTARSSASRVSEMLELLHAPALGVVMISRERTAQGYYYGRPTRLARLRNLATRPRSAAPPSTNGHGPMEVDGEAAPRRELVTAEDRSTEQP